MKEKELERLRIQRKKITEMTKKLKALKKEIKTLPYSEERIRKYYRLQEQIISEERAIRFSL